MYANLWNFGLVQGVCLGIDVQWKGDMIHEEDWGFDLYLGIIRISYMKIHNLEHLPDYDIHLEDEE